MGAGQSVGPSAEAAAFPASYEALPDNVVDMVEALCEKESTALLKPNLAAPPPFPPTLIGVKVQLDHECASAALATVRRLQRKHYETIPKSLSELDFFLSFFSHLTAIVNAQCPGAFDLEEEPEGAWKGVDAAGGPDTFTEAWSSMSESQKAAVAALCAKESSVLKDGPHPGVPACFPRLPIGMKCFIDEAAATAALSSVPGLQYKHYTLVPNKACAAVAHLHRSLCLDIRDSPLCFAAVCTAGAGEAVLDQLLLASHCDPQGVRIIVKLSRARGSVHGPSRRISFYLSRL